jgi:polysaccharide export outer membrane protein
MRLGHRGEDPHKVKRISGFMLSCLMMSLLLGCSSVKVRSPVGPAAGAQYVSFSNDQSRQLAASTQYLLSERAEDYRIGPEDMLEVTIFEWELREETKTVDVRVAESGSISLPVIGDIEVGQKTVAEVKGMIEDRLVGGGFIMAPRVSVNVKEYRSKKVAVVGAVTDPGVYTLRQNVTTLLDILSLAGGLNDRAGNLLYVVRPSVSAQDFLPHTPGAAPAEEQLLQAAATGNPGNPSRAGIGGRSAVENHGEVIAVDLYELMEMGNLSLNVVLQTGDIVNVPEAKRFAVIGYVGEPGSFPLKKPTTVLEGIAMAKGLKVPDASPGYCTLRRMTPEGEKIIPLNLQAISDGKAPNLYLQPDDVIEVGQTPGRKAFLGVVDGLRYIFNVGWSL